MARHIQATWLSAFACVAASCFATLALAQERSLDQFPQGVRDTIGPKHDATRASSRPRPQHPRPRFDATLTETLTRWNGIAIDASGLDHTPPAAGETRKFAEQLGPGRSSRAMAIVHIAMFEVANAADAKYKSYLGLPRVGRIPSSSVGVAQAAHDTLVMLFPSQAADFDDELADDLAAHRVGLATESGRELGRRAAKRILAARANDRSAHAEPLVGTEHITSNEPGHWRQDPVSQTPIALGAYWGNVRPFVLRSGQQFRVPPPPALNSAEYAKAFDEVKRVGGDGVTTPTERTAEQTHTGIFWAYDGTPSLCAPPRLYNQIAVQIAKQRTTTGVELARLLALVNVAMADEAIADWESKFYYDFWRPVGGLRESDPGTGPTGLGDGNDATQGDPKFVPFGAPASNLTGPNFTPPFPAYPSGHAGIGAALFQTLRNVYGTDKIPFTFTSDEYNGVTVGNDGVVRPLKPRSFSALSVAEEENGQSRMYLGIHWAFDKTAGLAQGRKVADYVYRSIYQPVRR